MGFSKEAISSVNRLFLAPKDWASVRTEGDPWPWFETVLDIADGQPGDGQAEGHTGVWHVAYSRYDWDMPHASYAAVSGMTPGLSQQMLHPDQRQSTALTEKRHAHWTRTPRLDEVDHRTV